MPLESTLREKLSSYCDSHLASDKWFENEFDFISDQKLAKQLALEFYSARYVYKLGEALAVTDKRLHAHNKFQIVQYASIYEAIIVHLLWKRYRTHPAVERISRHQTFKRISKLPKNVRLTELPNEELSICTWRFETTSTYSIKFDDKISAAVEIGFLHEQLGNEISEFYRLRNGIHLESAVTKQIQYELEQAQLAYRRMQPFIRGVKKFIQSSDLSRG